jgi:hypothetical protein
MQRHLPRFGADSKQKASASVYSLCATHCSLISGRETVLESLLAKYLVSRAKKEGEEVIKEERPITS